MSPTSYQAAPPRRRQPSRAPYDVKRSDDLGERSLSGARQGPERRAERSTPARADGRRGVGERAQDVARGLEDLAGGSVGDAQWLDVDGAGEAQVGEDRAPVAEPGVHEEALRGVAGQRDGGLWARAPFAPGALGPLVLRDHVEQDGEVDGGQVLGLVDEEVLEDERLLATPELAVDNLVA